MGRIVSCWPCAGSEVVVTVNGHVSLDVSEPYDWSILGRFTGLREGGYVVEEGV